MDATIDSSSGDTFTGFNVIKRKLSDQSEVIDFELSDD